MVAAVNSEPTVAIVVPPPLERHSLQQLLVSEGFPVDAFPHPEGFLKCPIPTAYGCLIVDLDHPEGAACVQPLINFAMRWSRELPVILIASDPTRLPRDPGLPGIEKSAGDTRLLYLVYGALSEPPSQRFQEAHRC